MFGKGVAFRSDGARLASAGLDVLAKIWHAASGVDLRTFKGHTYSVLSVARGPDGALLASASFDMTVRLWGVSTGRPLLILKIAQEQLPGDVRRQVVANQNLPLVDGQPLP
jgi:WD40 repeat protein